MNQLSGPVLPWIRSGYPEGIPDDESRRPASPCSRSGSGATATLDVLRRLADDGRHLRRRRRRPLPEDEQIRRVAAKLVLGGWPLGGDERGRGRGPRSEGSALARIVAWLREGYPGGVPEHDYLPLLALLERRLTRSEVKKVAKALRRADVSPAGPSDIAAAITEYTHTEPSDNDLRRVRDQLARKGWPVEFPDPDLD